MSSSFVALPVGQGDAFLFDREGKRLLVDGGKSAGRLLTLLATENVSHIDVVVCTHNDQDHAEGIAGLLEGDGCTVGEVWLPGRWSERIVDLCQAADDFARELSETSLAEEPSSLEVASRKPAVPQPEQAEGAGRKEPEGQGADQEQRILDAIDSMDDRGGLPWWPYNFSPKNWHLWVDCMNAAGRIRRIAKGARDVGARVRWFDYDEFRSLGRAAGGLPDLLVPVNAVEITPRVARKRLTAFEFLRLSVANSESLVFHAPPGTDEPEVLFSADSDLSFGLPVRAGALVTAPHHGSESNSAAYGRVTAAGGDFLWVRSDGRFQKRPGPTFLRQSAAFCTRCRHQTGPGQAVRMEGVARSTTWSWQPADGVAACSCRAR